MTRRRREFVAMGVHWLITDCLVYLLVIVTADQSATVQLIYPS